MPYLRGTDVIALCMQLRTLLAGQNMSCGCRHQSIVFLIWLSMSNTNPSQFYHELNQFWCNLCEKVLENWHSICFKNIKKKHISGIFDTNGRKSLEIFPPNYRVKRADAKSTPAYFSDLHFLGLIMQLSDLKYDQTESS